MKSKVSFDDFVSPSFRYLMKMLVPSATLLMVLFVCSTVSQSRFVAIGDWGIDNKDQYSTAKTLSKWCRKHNCSFVVSMGDNFYPSGITALDDPRFYSTWKNVYDLPGIIDLKWYLVLGNHDHLGCPLCQVEFSKKEAKWNLPSLWYDKTFLMDQASIHLIFIDTYTLVQELSGYQDQLQWLLKTLKKSNATWKIVVGHHPPFTAGRHYPGEKNIANYVIPVLEKYGVDVFLLGHDHNLQRIKRTDSNSVDLVIAGAGGMDKHPYTEGAKEYLKGVGYELEYFLKANGFVDFEVEEAKRLIVRYVTTKSGKVVYQFERSKQNRRAIVELRYLLLSVLSTFCSDEQLLIN